MTNTHSSLPLLAITMGDPAGIGPEVTVGALKRRRVREACRPLVIGDARIMQRAAEAMGLSFPAKMVASIAEANRFPNRICLLDLQNADPAAIPFGAAKAIAGRAAADCVQRAVAMARACEVAGLVTAPINKDAWRLAGVPYPGHTEMLAALCGNPRAAMMLVHGEMRVSHVTTHLSVREACDRITKERVLATIWLTHEALERLGVGGRIAVAGLNPHAGEQGLFGDEELHAVVPAVIQAKEEGIDAVGPLPPDTVFARQRAGEFDAVVAMLHDHGHVAIKTVGFARDRSGRMRAAGVNVTLGLPIIRTSADHGTAFDIAGKGTADPGSMEEAILLAARMAGEGRATA
jgi:4-hydroxythreonine-4-phosphate dehydrogenase